jgi:hypothetical protein
MTLCGLSILSLETLAWTLADGNDGTNVSSCRILVISSLVRIHDRPAAFVIDHSGVI